MLCPACSTETSGDHCTSCGTALWPQDGTTSGGETLLPDGVTGATTMVVDAATTIPPERDTTGPSDGLPLGIGQNFGPRYHIIQLLGAGATGSVFQAWDAELNVAVAVKIIRRDGSGDAADEAAFERRFKNELLLARQVTHKNVVRIFDLGEIDGVKYLTMPYIKGLDLATVLQGDGPLPLARALKIARQIAAGLEAGHEAGVVHGELGTANIMVAQEDHATILDFGLARSAAENLDRRDDIHAFGLIVREMVAGGGPDAPMPAGLPDPVNQIVAKCLDADPANRYQTATDLAGALDRIDDAGEEIPEPRRVSRRQMALALLLVTGLGLGTYIVGRRAAPPPRQRQPVPVLVADFDNRSGEPAFEGAVEQTLSIALEDAAYITIFKTRDARRIATELALGQGNRITQEVGQLIARREGIKVLVGGEIEAEGSGFRIRLHAIDPANATPIANANQYVRDKAQVLNAVTSMARRVREALGESETEMARLAAAETVTAGSLDAMRAYARAQEFNVASKFPEALQEYQRAVALDPQFGRAYAGIAGVYANYFKQPDKAEEAYQTAIAHVDRMTEREKYRTLGTYYIDIARNYEKAIENFETLVRLYPADDGGHGNLAFAYILTGNFTGAVAEVRKSLEIYPRNFLQRYNYAMYSMYTGDFATAVAEASRVRQESPSLEYAFLPIALSKLADGDLNGAHEAYASLASMSPFGASIATLGEADLNMYFGRHRAAIAMLRDGIDADVKNGKTASSQLARKYVAMADAYLASGQAEPAAVAAGEAIKLNRSESTLFPAARVLLNAGRAPTALQIAADLEKMLQPHTTAYARMITAEHAFGRGRLADGVEAMRDAQKRRDSWFSRYLLGKAYAEAGQFAEARAELELAVKRRAETTDVFIDDLPTLRYLPPSYYWLARAQEATGAVSEARTNYGAFLALRGDADPKDPLAADAQKRLAALR